jgi:predicted nucleic acid-binding protein
LKEPTFGGTRKETIEEIEMLLREGRVVARPREHLNLWIADLDDEWIVASAVAGGADVLVTGDAALLKAAKRSPVRILNLRGLWTLFRGADPSK